MTGTTRPWRVAWLLLGGALYLALPRLGADEPPMSSQLVGSGPAVLVRRARTVRPRRFSRRRSSSIRRVDPRRMASRRSIVRTCASGCDARAEGGEAGCTRDRHSPSPAAGRREGDPGKDSGGREHHSPGADRQHRAAAEDRSVADEPESARGGDERLAAGLECDPVFARGAGRRSHQARTASPGAVDVGCSGRRTDRRRAGRAHPA